MILHHSALQKAAVCNFCITKYHQDFTRSSQIVQMQIYVHCYPLLYQMLLLIYMQIKHDKILLTFTFQLLHSHSLNTQAFLFSFISSFFLLSLASQDFFISTYFPFTVPHPNLLPSLHKESFPHLRKAEKRLQPTFFIMLFIFSLTIIYTYIV